MYSFMLFWYLSYLVLWVCKYGCGSLLVKELILLFSMVVVSLVYNVF